jgi:outer membrane receptor protein involved in Fe transport
MFYDEFAWSTGRDSARESQRSSLDSLRAGVRGEPFTGAVLRANIMRGYRVPGFTELFGDGSYVSGNACLKAETNVQVDAGGEYSCATGPFSLKLEYVWYRNLLMI